MSHLVQSSPASKLIVLLSRKHFLLCAEWNTSENWETQQLFNTMAYNLLGKERTKTHRLLKNVFLVYQIPHDFVLLKVFHLLTEGSQRLSCNLWKMKCRTLSNARYEITKKVRQLKDELILSLKKKNDDINPPANCVLVYVTVSNMHFLSHSIRKDFNSEPLRSKMLMASSSLHSQNYLAKQISESKCFYSNKVLYLIDQKGVSHWGHVS